MSSKAVADECVRYAKELMEAPSCCAEAKAAAKEWMDAIGTDSESEKARALIAELEEDVTSIDGLIAFAGSEAGAKVFGPAAKSVEAHAREIKAEGAKYCDCPACAAGARILAHKDEII